MVRLSRDDKDTLADYETLYSRREAAEKRVLI